MIVTCESCSSRYKVDDAKVSGRGARITCPKCKHQFVVYASKATGASAAGDAKPGIAPQGPASEWDNEEPTRVGVPKSKPEGNNMTGVFPIGGRPSMSEDSAEGGLPTQREPASALKGLSPRAATGPVIPPIPPPEPSRSRGPEPTPSLGPAAAARSGVRSPEPTPSLGPMPSPRGRVSTAQPAAAAAFAPNPDALENDIADAPSGVYVKPTVSKADDAYEVAVPPPTQRLSTADAATRAPTLDFRKVGVKHWKVKVKIGLTYDFSDLKTLRKYIADGRVTPSDLISHDAREWKAIGDIPDLDVFFVETYDRLAVEQASRPPEEVPPPVSPTRSIPPTPISSLGPDSDPFSVMKNRTKDPTRRTTATGLKTTTAVTTPPKTTSNAPMILGVLLLLAVVGGGLWWSQQQHTTTTAPVKATEPVETAPATGTGTELPGNLRIVEDPGTPAVRPEDQLTPVAPGGRTPRVPSTAGTPGTSGSKPEPTTSGTGPKASTASDHAAAGDDFAKAGQWADAAKAYGKAVAADPKNVSYQSKLGQAAWKAGDLDTASSALRKARQMGSKDASKYLGYVLRDMGDTAGAVEAWTSYLKSNPKDAEIDKQLKALNGG